MKMNRVNTIINTVKSHLNQYNFIETDFEIQDNKLIISIYPRYEFIEINKDLFKIVKVIEADYKINVYRTLNNYINR